MSDDRRDLGYLLKQILDKLTSGITTTSAPAGTSDVNIKQVNGATPTGTGAIQVQGTAADNAVPVGSPVMVAGFDGTNVQYVSVEGSGQVKSSLYAGGVSLTPVGGNSDNVGAGTNGLIVISWNELFNGSTGWDRERTPNKFKPVATAAAGNTALWTPAAGTKFRLMGYIVEVTGQAIQAAGGTLTITLFDGAAGVTGFVHSVYVPAIIVPSVGGYSSGFVALRNGYLSVLANNVLNVNLSTALTAGVVNVIAVGTEE